MTTKFKNLREATKANPYAIGMSVVKKKMGLGTAPVHDLPKSAIVKAHDIAKKIKANEEFDVELDQLDENLRSAAKDLKDYAKDYDGMDKKDFETAANHMEAGDHEALEKHVKGLDSEPRDKILTTLNKHGNDIKRYGYSMREEVETIDEISKATTMSYLDKAPRNARILGQISTEYKNASERKRNPGLKRVLDKLSQKYKKHAWRREEGIKKAIKKVAGDK